MIRTKINVIPNPKTDLLPDPQVAQRDKVTPRTINNWDRQPELGFPPAVRINGRKYRHLHELESWERQRVAEA